MVQYKVNIRHEKKVLEPDKKNTYQESIDFQEMKFYVRFDDITVSLLPG